MGRPARLIGMALYHMSMMPAWLTEPRAGKQAPQGDDRPAGRPEEGMGASDRLFKLHNDQVEADKEVSTGSMLPASWTGSTGGPVFDLIGRSGLSPLTMDTFPNYLLPELPLHDPSLPAMPASAVEDSMVDSATDPGSDPMLGGNDAVDDEPIYQRQRQRRG